jgi:diguanylate cyclase (GGDEF)-like protein
MKIEHAQAHIRVVEEPFSRDALFRLVGPLVAAFLATLLAATRGYTQTDGGRFVIAAALVVLTAAATAFLPWDRLPPTLRALPPFIYLAAGFLITMPPGRVLDAGEVAFLPVVWLALYGTLSELLVLLSAVLVADVAALYLPDPVSGGVTRMIFLFATAVILGIVVYQVVQQVRRQSRHLRSLARRDDLTAVSNRRAWDEEIETAVRFAKAGEPMAVALLDVDHFKAYNDRAGHQAGDRLLREIALAWSTQLRRTDTLARIGGDEFALLLRDCPPEDAEEVLERLCARMPEGVTCSAGLACWDDGEPPQSLMSRADAALYRAKAAGRDRVEVWRGSRRLVRPEDAEARSRW